MNKDILTIKREFVHAIHAVNNKNKEDDALFVKEILHNSDGKIRRSFRRIDNYQRDFYITKKEFQDHTQKKEFEYLNKLDKHQSNQTQLAKAMFKAIKGYSSKGYVNKTEISSDPFIYGTDVNTPVLLANEYRVRYPNLSSDSTLAVLDYETDVLNGTDLIISGVLSMKNNLHIAVTKEFLGNLASTAKEDIINALNLHLKEYMIDRKINNPIITICDTPAKVVLALMKSAHQWQPDFIGIWNIEFDVKKMLQALELEHIDPAQVFSDPTVPNEFKFCKWREASAFKMTSSGKRTPIHPADRWHSFTAPSSFQFICLMSLFKFIRSRDQQRPKYKLDAILNEFLNLGKLRFKSVPDNIVELEWHKVMQRHHKIEYMVYMAFDGIGCELLDEKTNDVSRSLRATLGVSELTDLKHNPKRLIDDKHFTLLEDGKVIGSTSGDMRDEFDSLTPSINDWICTLPSELEHRMGRRLITEYPLLDTNITAHAFDVDIISAYPTSEIVLNVSKTTRYLELCKIDGLNTSQTRAIGINLTNVNANALSLAQTCYGFPSLNDLLDKFQKEIML